LLWKRAFIVQRLWVASRHVESATKLFFLTVYHTIDRISTVIGAMNNASEHYRETYDEKKKVFSVQNSLGLYFKTLKPVQHMQKTPKKQHCQQNPTKSQPSNHSFPTKLRRFYLKNADDAAPSS